MFQTNITWFSLQLIYTSIIFKSSFASFNFQVDVWLKKKNKTNPPSVFRWICFTIWETKPTWLPSFHFHSQYCIHWGLKLSLSHFCVVFVSVHQLELNKTKIMRYFILSHMLHSYVTFLSLILDQLDSPFLISPPNIHSIINFSS